MSDTFRNDRWRKYMVNLTEPHDDWARRLLAAVMLGCASDDWVTE